MAKPKKRPKVAKKVLYVIVATNGGPVETHTTAKAANENKLEHQNERIYKYTRVEIVK